MSAVFHQHARAAAAPGHSARASSRVAPRVRPLPVGLSPSVAGSRSSPTVCGFRFRGGGGRSASPRRSIFLVLFCLGASLRAPLLPRCPLLLRRRRLLGTLRVALALWGCALRLGSAVNGRFGSPRPAACGSVRGSYGAGVRGWRYAPAAKGLTAPPSPPGHFAQAPLTLTAPSSPLPRVGSLRSPPLARLRLGLRPRPNAHPPPIIIRKRKRRLTPPSLHLSVSFPRYLQQPCSYRKRGYYINYAHNNI